MTIWREESGRLDISHGSRTASSGFIAWWWRRMALLLQRALPRPTRERRLVLRFEQESLELRCEGRGQPKRARLAPEVAHDPAAVRAEIRQLGAEGLPVFIELSPGDCLLRDVTLPRAAAENLHAVLGYQIDKLTPWPASQVLFDACPAEPGGSDEDLQVHLVAVHKSKVAAVQQQARKLQLLPRAIVPPAERLPSSRGATKLNLMPHEETGHKGATRLLATLLILMVALYAAGLGWLTYTYLLAQRQQEEIGTLIDTARLKAAAVERERAALEDLRDERSYLLEKKQQAPSTLLLLEELSRRLPAGTWLTGLSLEEREVTLSGYSNDASALIPLLEDSEAFSEVRFSASTRIDEQSGAERFEIEMIEGAVEAFGARGGKQ